MTDWKDISNFGGFHRADRPQRKKLASLFPGPAAVGLAYRARPPKYPKINVCHNCHSRVAGAQVMSAAGAQLLFLSGLLALVCSKETSQWETKGSFSFLVSRTARDDALAKKKRKRVFPFRSRRKKREIHGAFERLSAHCCFQESLLIHPTRAAFFVLHNVSHLQR